MNTKKKPQRYSHKKLLSTTRRGEARFTQQPAEKQSSLQNANYSSQQNKQSSRNKSAQKILSVYESSRAKFKIGKFLNSDTRHNQTRLYRIRTQADQCQKTNKITSVRKVGQKQKQKEKQKQRDQKVVVRQLNSGSKGKVMYDTQKDMMTKQRTFNKRLNLNSELFQNINNSFQKSMVPQTSKHQKKPNFSFRKEHDSYRAMNKRTALQKYISQSLQNLQCPNPVKKKNSRNIMIAKGNDDIIQLKKSKQKQHQTTRHEQKNTTKKHLLIYKGSKQATRQANDLSLNKYQQFFQNNTDQIRQSRSVRGGKKQPEQQLRQNHHSKEQPSHRRIKTQQQGDESLQKIEIKWEKKKKNVYDLSNEEMETFGDRFPDGFDKVSLLGRGGFSLVWLGEHKKSKKQYAVKQIITQSNHQTHKKQIWFGTYFFEFGGVPKQQFVSHTGIKNLVKLYYYFVNKKDTWLLYEKCGDSLGNALYELKGQHYNGEKMYRIHYKELYSIVRKDLGEIKKIIYEMAKALQLLAENNIVHSDLKTENILVKLRVEGEGKQLQGQQQEGKTVDAKQSARKLHGSQSKANRLNKMNSVLQEVKLIDYGSSFRFSNLRQFSMATPQYMAPQILNFILYQNQLQYIPKLFQYVQQYNDSWVIDIWSLGCVILEIVSGIPLWMSLKTIVKKRQKQVIRYGLFAVKGRTFDKIIKKQLEVVQNMDQYLQEENYSGIVVDEELKFLLKRMLALNPAKRISPEEIMQFFQRGGMSNSARGGV